MNGSHSLFTGRLAVALVLVQLARGDSVAAEKAFKEWGNCCDANEVQTLEMLLQVNRIVAFLHLLLPRYYNRDVVCSGL